MRLLAALLLLASTAMAQEVALDGTGSACPTREAVATALTALVPGAHIVERDAKLTATLRDRGATYSITTTRERTIPDPRRRCAERARAAALVIALAIEQVPDAEPALAPTFAPALVPPPELPWALIDRPAALPSGNVSVREEVVFSTAQKQAGPNASWAFGAADQITFDFGVGHRLQLGAWIGVPFQQGNVDFSIVPHAIVALPHDVALRIELGFERTHYADSDPANSLVNTVYAETNGVFFALAPVYRRRLHKMLTLSFGDAGLRDEWPTQISRVGTSSGAGLSNALLSLEFTGVSGTAVRLCFPAGLLFQPHRTVALLLQAGVRLTFFDYGFDRSYTSIPVSLDLIVTPHRRFDLGVTVYSPLAVLLPAEIHAALFFRVRI